MISTEERLKAFQEENNIYTKGPLSLVVQFTRLVRNKDFPLNPDDFQTSSKGQVAGLGGGNLKKILKEHIEDIFATWKNINPKIHFSTPKNKTKRDFRSHHDYINSDDFIQFIEKIKKYNVDIDVMIEAKAKDDALFRLVRELKYKTNYKFIDETSFEV